MNTKFHEVCSRANYSLSKNIILAFPVLNSSATLFNYLFLRSEVYNNAEELFALNNVIADIC
ncbi:MAG: hypothetical protein AB7P01_16405 [Bacteroidia bacterium]